MKTLICLAVGLLFLATLHAQVADRVLQARPFCMQRVSSGGIRLQLTGIYIDSSLLWLVFRAGNQSAIDFRAGSMRFFIRNKHAMKRRALQELRLSPLVRREAILLRSNSTVSLCYGLVPRVPGKHQELVVEWVERNGDRRMQLHVRAAALLRARKL